MVQLKRVFRATARAALAVMLICLASGQASAASVRSWTLETQSGQVQLVKTGISPIALTPGDVFAAGDWIETGPDGRAILRRGEETIVVAPNSRIGLPTDNTGPFATRILHTLGTILLTVEKKAKQHFEVQTPYLTAVVKGTTFTVGIQNGRSVVHVVEGLVQVKNLASGRSTLVRPGQTGAVRRGGSADVQVDGGVANTAAVDQAASVAPVASETANQAASAASETRGNSDVVKIKQALGPKTLDLSKSTKGLVRAASRAAPQAAVGKAKGKDPKVKGAKVKGAKVKGAKVKVAKVKVAKVKVAKVKVAKVKVAKVKVAKVKVAKVKVAKVKVVKVAKVAKVKTPKFKAAKVKVPKVKTPKFKVAKVKVPKVKGNGKAKGHEK